MKKLIDLQCNDIDVDADGVAELGVDVVGVGALLPDAPVCVPVDGVDMMS